MWLTTIDTAIKVHEDSGLIHIYFLRRLGPLLLLAPARPVHHGFSCTITSPEPVASPTTEAFLTRLSCAERVSSSCHCEAKYAEVF
jgi:hypothetical protein